MKLQQLKYLVSIADNNLSITAAAESLYTSQPGISKQLRLLEEELNVTIFERSGKQLTSITAIGEEIIQKARNILQETYNIKQLTSESLDVNTGSFAIATTQTQAQYILPKVFSNFHQRYPNLSINLQQGTTDQIMELLQSQKVEFAIASGNQDLGSDIVKIPCYHWDRVLLFPFDHPLGDLKEITLADVCQYPIVTYEMKDKNASSLFQACNQAGVKPNVVFTAQDANIIKTYVKNGFGVGIIASMAHDPKADKDLINYSTKKLLPRCTTWIAFNRNLLLRNYMKYFIHLFAPHIADTVFNQYRPQANLSSVDLVNQLSADEADTESNLPMHESWHI